MAYGNRVDSVVSEGDSLASLASLLAAVAQTPRVPPIVPGTLVAGRYLVTGVVGAGGMGVVYRARDMRLERDVALKLCSRVGADESRRILGEALAMARLSHPNVITVFEVGQVEDDLFLVMELVSGSSARRWVGATRRGWREVLRVYLDAASGLSAVHRAGLVHGDFKPDNLIVGDDGRARLADFGLARVDDGGRPAGGTPRYLAPELRDGWFASQRSDQYAFCVALGESLSTCRGRPRALARIVGRGLAEDPARRWESMLELRRELRGRLEARRRSFSALAIIAAALLLMGGALWLARRVAETSEREASMRRAALETDVELGRRELQGGDAQSALVYLAAALEGGVDRPAVRYLVARGLSALERNFVELARPRAPVTAALLLRLGPRAVVGDAGGAVQLFGTDGQLLRTFAGHRRAISSLAVDPAGRRLLSSSADGVRLWDVESGELVTTLAGERARFTVDGQRLLTPDGIWGLDGKRLAPLAEGAWLVTQVREGGAIYTADGGGVRVFSATGKPLARLPHISQVTSIDADAAGRVATGARDGVARVWDGTTLRAQLRHPERVGAVRFLGGERLLTACDDGQARLWDLTSASVLMSFGHSGPITTLLTDGEGRRAITASLDGTARFWDLASARRVADLVGHEQGVLALAVSEAGDLALTGSDDGTARLWSVSPGELIGSLAPAARRFEGAWFAGLDQVLALEEGGALSVYRSRAGGWDREARPLLSGVADRRAVAVSADGSRYALLDGGVARVWDLDARTEIAALKMDAGTRALTLDLHGRRLLGFGDGAAIWDVTTGARRARITTLWPVVAAALSPDGERAAIAAEGDTLVLWRGARTSVHLPAAIADVAFDPTGTLVALASADASVTVVDAFTGSLARRLGRHGAPAEAVRWAPDGALLFSLGSDRRVRVWDLATAAELSTLQVDAYAGLDLAPDGARLLVRQHLGGVSFWDVSREPRAPAQVAEVVACLVPLSLDALGRLVPHALDARCRSSAR